MKVLITGANGLLGQKLVDYCQRKEIAFLATSKGKNRNSNCPAEVYQALDVTDKAAIQQVIEKWEPSHVIHTAAMTNVDQCENEPDQCELLNVTATEYLMDVCIQTNTHFQLLSTDFIFDGEKGNYQEDDEPNPLSEYARSKVKAEAIVTENGKTDNWSIVRTIIVYGRGEELSRSNIVLWAKSALEKGGPLSIVDDQFRAPTYADDLAAGCMGVIEHNKTGVFHVSGPETMSIYELVTRIARHFDYPTDSITKVSSKTLNQAAKRPPKTGFNLEKAYTQIDYKPRTLEETLTLLF